MCAIINMLPISCEVMPGESYCKRLKSFLLYLCYGFWALINSLVSWFHQLQDCKNNKTNFSYQLNQSISVYICICIFLTSPVLAATVAGNSIRQNGTISLKSHQLTLNTQADTINILLRQLLYADHNIYSVLTSKFRETRNTPNWERDRDTLTHSHTSH